MKRARGIFVTVAALAVVTPGASAAILPVEAFARLPELHSADLSPDGTRALSVATVEGRPAIAVMDLDAPQPRWQLVMKAESNDFRARWCRFKTRDRILCGFRGTQFMNGVAVVMSRLIALDADGRNAKVLMKNTVGGQFQDRIVDMLWDDPTHVLVETDDDFDGYPSVARVDVHTGTARNHSGQRQPIRSFYSDGRGVVRLAEGMNGTSIAWFARDENGKPWRELDRYKAFQSDGVAFVGFGTEPGQLYVNRSHEGRDALWLLDLGDRENPKLVYSHPLVDIGGPVMWNDRLVGVSYQAERPEVYWLDPDARALFAQLKRAFPDTFPDVVGESRDGRRLLLDVYADRQPSKYVLLDRTTNQARVLAYQYPGLSPDNLASMKSISYKARDGAVIPGYLTVPNGVAPAGLPLIVMPHGGPIARDTWGFDFLQQFLVSRGYAVLQMDFRGSSGYGDAWYGAAHQDWGGLTYDDVIDGVRWAIDRKVADPRRVAVLGWSFGGYIALLGAARDSELFRCAVSIAGVTDLRRFLSFTENFSNAAIAREQLGTDGDDLRANSPRRLVAGVRIPILMFQGTADTQVPAAQGRLMRDALKRAGKAHEYIEFEDETHQIDHEANRVAMLRRIESFLAEHLSPAPADSAR